MLQFVAMAVTGAVAAYSQYQQGRAQRQMNDYNAALGEQEAFVRARDARYAAQAARDDGGRLVARQRALYATAGVVSTAGSPLAVLAQQTSETELKASDMMRRGNAEASALRSQSLLDRLAGKSAYRAGVLGAVGTLSHTAANIIAESNRRKAAGIT
jgi:hypothetical protein